MLCPSCKTPLSIADRSGIEIDYCPTCRGVWLDRGELDKIIERAAATMHPAEARRPAAFRPQMDHAPRGHDHGYYGKRKRKSFLSEIFDFD